MSDYQKRGYLLENFRLFHLKTQNENNVDFHYHEFSKLVFFVSGKGEYYVEGQRYRLQAGDIILVGSRSVHKPEIEIGHPYERIILYISPDYLTRESDELLRIFSGEKGHVLRPTENQRRKLFEILQELEQDMSKDGFGKDALCRAGLLRLLVEIGRSFSKDDFHHPSPIVPTSKRIVEITKYIDKNITENLDIDQIAEEFYISKYHMMRLFHQETGATIYTYITLKRLIMAKELIDGGMRATEACYQSGFKSYSSFTRSYGKHFGTTPTGRADKRFARTEDVE